jgi:hypothetical protein
MNTLTLHPSDALRAAIDRKRTDRAKAQALLDWMVDDPNGSWIINRLMDLVLHLHEQGRLAPRSENRCDMSPALAEVLEAARRQPWSEATWRKAQTAEWFLGPVQSAEERAAKDKRLTAALTKMGAMNDRASSPRVKAALMLASVAEEDEDALLDKLEAYARKRLAKLRAAQVAA